MNSSRRLWIDMTDLSAWSGYLTGTQRVSFEVAKAYAESNETDLHFFVYDERSRCFYETSFDPILERVTNALKSQESVPGAKKPRFHHPSPKGIAVAQSLRVYRSLPFKVKNKITPERKDQAKRVYHRLSAMTRKRRQTQLIKRAAKSGPAITFTKQDTVIILGKPWDTMSFIDVLRVQKLAADFRVVHLIYDMVPSFLPHTFGYPLPSNYTTYMFEAISLSDQLIAISESTKRDIVRFCEEELLPAPPITVVKLGDSQPPADGQERSQGVAGLTPGSFILYVSTVEIRKNHILLYTAYREGVRRGLPLPKLVIVGGKGWYTEDVLHEFKNDPALQPLVTVMHKTNDDDKSWLFRNCRFTVYPSVYEGWGLPIAESLAYGKACISSDTSSMTEVGGNLVDYFSPYDSAACLEAIMKFMDDATLAKREKKIQVEYHPFSWLDSAQAVQKVVAAASRR